MNPRQPIGGNTRRSVHRVWLYLTVFTTRTSTLVVFLLFLSFLIQPFHLALANEASAEETTESTLPDEVAEQLPDSTQASESQVQNTFTESSETEVTEQTNEPEDTDDTEQEAAEQTSGDTESGVDNSNDLNSATTSTENDLSVGTDTDNVSSTTESTPEEESGNSAASTTIENQNVTASSTNSGGGQVTESSTSTEESYNVETDAISATSSSSTGQSNSGTGSGGGDNQSGDTSSSTPTTTDQTASSTTSTSTTTESEPNTATLETGANTADTTTSENDGVDNEPSTTTDDLIDGQQIQDGVNGLVDNVVNEVVNLTRQLVTEENYYQFSRQSCAPVGDGTFYCTAQNDAPVDPDSAVFAEQDSDGDLEIFIRTTRGEVKQLTNNSFDDSSPDLDLATMKVVWQRLIDGRYQVISYDLETQTETQLTFSKNNSMEPKISKEGIVWQAWDGNDWEIMYFDGQFTEQITSNEIQDVTPVIEDGYILWSVLGGEKSEARVYSIENQEIMTITGYEGGAITNPRFVLVYDTKFDNGDIITQGFDPITGLAQPLAAKPNDRPMDIPEPDPVGEIRALIQNKSIHDENEVVAVPTGDAEGDLDLASTTATSSDTLSIGNQADVDDADTTLEQTDEFDFNLDEYDLVITDTASSTTADMNDEILKQAVPTSTASVTISTAE